MGAGRPQHRHNQYEHSTHALMRKGRRRPRQRLVVPLDLVADNIENSRLTAAEQMKKPHGKGDVEIEKIGQADNVEINKNY